MEEVMQMIDFVAPIEDKMQGIIKVVGDVTPYATCTSTRWGA